VKYEVAHDIGTWTVSLLSGTVWSLWLLIETPRLSLFALLLGLCLYSFLMLFMSKPW
jgi:hypothetical protein